MRVLLDTRILLWALIEPRRLRKEIVVRIRDPANEILFSAASIAEIAIKVAQGRFDVAPERIVEAATNSGYAELPVASRHAARLASMPMHHRDPFDRLLVAQALEEPARLLTADRKLAPYSELAMVV